MREVSKTMNQQLHLIRLIIQKMEISTENDCGYEIDYDREADCSGEPTPLNRMHAM